MTVGTVAWPLASAASTHATRLAVIDGDRRVTYAELHERSQRIGGGLAILGIEPGEVVALLLANSLEHLELYQAVPSHGRVLASMNTRLTVPELAFMVDDSGARALVVDESTVDAGRALREQCDLLERVVYVGADPPDDCTPYDALLDGPPVHPLESDPESVAALMYTGGTTGLPKGVMLSHANLIANAKHILHTLDLQHDERFLHSGPIFHLGTSQFVLPLIWIGATHVIQSRFSPPDFVHQVNTHEVTLCLLVPTMIQVILEHLRKEPTPLSSLRMVHYGASAMSTTMVREAIERMGCEFTQGYGMTEASPQVCVLPGRDHVQAIAGEHEERLKSVGYPIPGVQLSIRDAEGTEVEDGTVGEVWARGPNIMLGYFGREQETRSALVDGWYRTGDGGYCDSDGYLYLVDRLKDMIISGGENVYSMEVEQVIFTHPDVIEVAVVGVPDDRWGERVHAVIVVREGSTFDAEDLAEHCRPRLAGYKLPRSADIGVEPLPKSGAGKILKEEVRRMLRERLEEQA